MITKLHGHPNSRTIVAGVSRDQQGANHWISITDRYDRPGLKSYTTNTFIKSIKEDNPKPFTGVD